MSVKAYYSYNRIHKLCQESGKALSKANVDVIVAIGGGGFIPARMLRTFLKRDTKNLPIVAICLSLYEPTESVDEETIGQEVVRVQWLDLQSFEDRQFSLLDKHILIVDEVDDTRTTLQYAVRELTRDLDALAATLGRKNNSTLSVFVLHNKDKPKMGKLPAELELAGRYHAAETLGDTWIVYPWESDNIEAHTALAAKQGNT